MEINWLKVLIFGAIGFLFVLYDARKGKGTKYIGGSDLIECPRCRYDKPKELFKSVWKIPAYFTNLIDWDVNKDRDKLFCDVCIWKVNLAFLFGMIFGLIILSCILYLGLLFILEKINLFA